MSAIKVLGIIGIVLACMSFFCVAGFSESDPTASVGWGIIAAAYLLAISIVATCQKSNRIEIPRP